MVLTVAEILEGIEKYEEVEIKALNDTVYLRPLSKSEWAKVDSIRQEALGDYVTNEKAKALKNRTQRTAEINSQLKFNFQIVKLSPHIFDEMYEKVCELSGINRDLEDEVEEFPENE